MKLQAKVNFKNFFSLLYRMPRIVSQKCRKYESVYSLVHIPQVLDSSLIKVFRVNVAEKNPAGLV